MVTTPGCRSHVNSHFSLITTPATLDVCSRHSILDGYQQVTVELAKDGNRQVNLSIEHQRIANCRKLQRANAKRIKLLDDVPCSASQTLTS
jgi:hypothetical protein